MSVKQIVVWGTAWLFSATSLARAGDAPLADAAEIMDRAGVSALVEEFADVNASQVDGMTALHWAARHDDLGIAKLLVRAGAGCERREPIWSDAAHIGLHKRKPRAGRVAPRCRSKPEHQASRGRDRFDDRRPNG